MDLILQEREENGTYKTLQSFLERVSCREVNKRAVENLIKAGALDGLDGNRQQMITDFFHNYGQPCLGEEKEHVRSDDTL